MIFVLWEKIEGRDFPKMHRKSAGVTVDQSIFWLLKSKLLLMKSGVSEQISSSNPRWRCINPIEKREETDEQKKERPKEPPFALANGRGNAVRLIGKV